jgi:hypothetical protein
MTINAPEDEAILQTVERMREVLCCETAATGCFHRHGDCCCSCAQCLCGYVAYQIEQGEALVSRYVPKLGYAVIVEVTESEDNLEGGELVALIAPGKVWFPETTTGWISFPTSETATGLPQ